MKPKSGKTSKSGYFTIKSDNMIVNFTTDRE